MDVYLPADFHELHDHAPDDWRDLPAARREPLLLVASAQRATNPTRNICADPTWYVF